MITDPGKFEGCPDYTPILWDRTLDGCFAESFMVDDREHMVIPFTAEDKVEFPAVAKLYGVILYEDSNGFVYCEEYPDQDSYNAACEELEQLEVSQYEAMDAANCALRMGE